MVDSHGVGKGIDKMQRKDERNWIDSLKVVPTEAG